MRSTPCDTVHILGLRAFAPVPFTRIPAVFHPLSSPCPLLHWCVQVGESSPDVDPALLKAAFNTTQQLLEEGKLLAGHDISDGGIVTAVRHSRPGGWAGMATPASQTLRDMWGLHVQVPCCFWLFRRSCSVTWGQAASQSQRLHPNPNCCCLRLHPPLRRCWRWRLPATAA